VVSKEFLIYEKFGLGYALLLKFLTLNYLESDFTSTYKILKF
jgi:hypothetical protein